MVPRAHFRLRAGTWDTGVGFWVPALEPLRASIQNKFGISHPSLVDQSVTVLYLD
jgi:hypothetical protein